MNSWGINDKKLYHRYYRHILPIFFNRNKQNIEVFFDKRMQCTNRNVERLQLWKNEQKRWGSVRIPAFVLPTFAPFFAGTNVPSRNVSPIPIVVIKFPGDLCTTFGLAVGNG